MIVPEMLSEISTMKTKLVSKALEHFDLWPIESWEIVTAESEPFVDTFRFLGVPKFKVTIRLEGTIVKVICDPVGLV
ncbi:hypothetical protein LCGC14_1586930 [marine sediment metagenome]|uniref:Uncharacterized protein n=1 Tax=marine sediment metagenome TaxID=412755 RepID=A0A0F9LFK4_9ZZZZ